MVSQCNLYIMLLALILFPLSFQFANSQEISEEPNVFIHNSKVSETKYLGFDSNPIKFSIFVQNMNKTHSTSVELIPGTLVKSSESLNSDLPDYIHINDAELEKQISPDTVSEFNLSLEDVIRDESSYSGKIQLKQGNKDPTIIEVELNYKTDPLISIILAIIGMSSAGMIGILYSWKEKRSLHGKSITSGDSTIEHVNKHIDDLNRLRHRMYPKAWKSLQATFQAKKSVIEAHRDMLSLSEDLEEVKWLDEVLKEIEKKYYTNDDGTTINEEHIETILLKLRTIFLKNKIDLQEKIIFGLTDSKKDLESTVRKLKLLNGMLYEYEKSFDTFTENKALPFIKQLPRETKIGKLNEIIYSIKIHTERNKLVKKWESDLKFLDNVRNILNNPDNSKDYSSNEKEILKKLNKYILRKHFQLTNYISKLKNNLDTTPEERKNLEDVIEDFKKKKNRLEKDTVIIEKLLEEKPKRLANRDIFNKKNIFQVFAMGIIAIPAALFITDNFSGPVFLNGLISFTTGFAVYKIPDVKSIFKK